MSMLIHSSCKNLFHSLRFVRFHFFTRHLITDHKFSTRLASELFKGQSITSGTPPDNNYRASQLLCLGSLFCCSRHRRPNSLLPLGMRWSLNVLRAIYNYFKGVTTNEALDTDASPYHHLHFSICMSWPSTNGIAKQLSLVNRVRLQWWFLCWIVHWIGACFWELEYHRAKYSCHRLVSVDDELSIRIYSKLGDGAVFRPCCLIVLPNPLTKCPTVVFSRSWHVQSTLLSNLRDIIFRSLCYTKYCSWRSLVVIPKNVK